jgi:tetratricopeptide (TPR) repeat protein
MARHARLPHFNYFELLDVSESADGETIRRAFQQAVRRFHPDRLVGEHIRLRPLAQDIVSRIGTAYRVLENEATRQQYRQSLTQYLHLSALRSSMRPGNPAFRPSNMPSARQSSPAFRPSSLPSARSSSAAFRAPRLPEGPPPCPRPSKTNLPSSASIAALEMAKTFVPEEAFEAARVQLKRAALDEALALIEQACTVEPEHPQYRALHAWLRVQRGELKPGTPAAAEILKVLTWAVRERRNDLEIRMYRGRVLQRLGRPDEAIRDFAVVASIDETNLEAIREVRLHRARQEQKASSSGTWSKLFKNS